MSALVLGSDGWYIIRIQEHTEVSEENIQALIAAERERLFQDRRRSAFNTWLQGLRSSAKIVDNRSKVLGHY